MYSPWSCPCQALHWKSGGHKLVCRPVESTLPEPQAEPPGEKRQDKGRKARTSSMRVWKPLSLAAATIFMVFVIRWMDLT